MSQEINLPVEIVVENLSSEYLLHIKDLSNKLAQSRALETVLAQEVEFWKNKSKDNSTPNEKLEEKKTVGKVYG